MNRIARPTIPTKIAKRFDALHLKRAPLPIKRNLLQSPNRGGLGNLQIRAMVAVAQLTKPDEVTVGSTKIETRSIGENLT